MTWVFAISVIPPYPLPRPDVPASKRYHVPALDQPAAEREAAARFAHEHGLPAARELTTYCLGRWEQ